MKVFSSILSLFFFIVCNPKNDSSNSSNSSLPKEGEMYEVLLHHFYLESKWVVLEQEKNKIQGEIESGNEKALAKLEAIQKDMLVVSRNLEILQKQMDGVIPKLPPPPKPCIDPKINNCPIPTPKSSTIVLLEGNEDAKISITSLNQESLTNLRHNGNTFILPQLKSGIYVLNIQKYDKSLGGKIAYSVPIKIE